MPEDFDFDTWAALATRDPAAFEVTRCQALDKVISRNPGRLRRLQWRVDAERRRARTPLKACLVLSGMMWAAFAELRYALDSALEKIEAIHPGRPSVPGAISPPSGQPPSLDASSLRRAAHGNAGRVLPFLAVSPAHRLEDDS